MPAAVFLVTFAFYVSGLAPSIYWLDSSELAAAAFGLGVAHPPGHPLALLLGKACALVPLGPIALRVGLASALCGAAAAAQTASLGRLLAARAAAGSNERSVGRWTTADCLGGAAGILFGLSYAAGFQAVRPEVYALSTLCVVGAALALARFDESGALSQLYAAALWSGLALSNHHLLALAWVVPALLLVALRRPSAASWGRVALLGLVGLTPFAYLPLRAARHPLVDWGAPTTATRFYWTVSAQAFQKAVARGTSSDAGAAAAALAAQLHPIGFLMALAGVYLMVRLPSLRRLGLTLFAAAVLDAAAPALVGFDVANPDAYGYLAAAVALLAACACALPSVLAAALPRARGLLVAATCAAALAWGALGWPRVARAGHRDTAAVVGGWLATAPPRATIVTSYFQTVFALWYLRDVEGQRPDADLVHRHFLAYPGYRDDLARRVPSLAPLLGARDVDAAALDGRPVLIEYDLDLPAPLAARAQPIPVGGVDLDEPQTRRYAAWQAFLAAHRGCMLHTPEAPAALAAARALFGDAPELAALAQNCDRPPAPATIGP